LFAGFVGHLALDRRIRILSREFHDLIGDVEAPRHAHTHARAHGLKGRIVHADALGIVEADATVLADVGGNACASL
jgi:hypothetical protein